MIQEHERVVLLQDIPEERLVRGDIGVVVMVHSQPGYEVEFMTLTGDTLAVVSVSPDQVRPVDGRDMPHARPLQN